MYELNPISCNDSLMYFFMGRGLANGLVPYHDLFESKPPAAFYTAFMSLLTTGDFRGGYVAQALILAGYILLPAAYLVPWVFRKYERKDRLLVLAASAVFFSGMLLYTAKYAAQFQTESFGAFFGIWYVLHIAFTRNTASPLAVAASAAFILLAIAWREPFILILPACSLLLASNASAGRLLSSLVLPGALAGVIGVLLFHLLGVLGPYVGTYLPFLFAARLNPAGAIPLWQRGLEIGRIFGHVLKFSVLLQVAIVALIGAYMLWPSIEKKEQEPAVILSLSVLSFLFFEGYAALIQFRILGKGILFPSSNEIQAMILAEVMTPVFLAVAILSFVIMVMFFTTRDRLRILQRATITVLVVYLAGLAVGAGGDYQDHHFIFAVPVYVAFFLTFIKHCAEYRETHNSGVLGRAVLVLLILSCFTFLWSIPSTEQRKQNRRDLESAKRMAWLVDQTLESCGENRYMYIGPGSMPGAMFQPLAHHSAYGPLLGQHSPMFEYPGSFLSASTDRNLLKTNIIVLDNTPVSMRSGIQEARLRYVAANFSTDSACGADYASQIAAEGYTALFRVNN